MSSASKTTTAARRAEPLGAVDLSRMRRPPTHPGEILLEDVFKPLGYGSQSEAARRTGMSLNRLNEILRQERPVTPESAVLIGAVTGTDPQFWMRLQAQYDLWHAIQKIDTSKIKPLTAPKDGD